jgi:hypothetical protein
MSLDRMKWCTHGNSKVDELRVPLAQNSPFIIDNLSLVSSYDCYSALKNL